MVVNISPVPALVAFPSEISFQNSDSQRCAFSRERGRWTLEADCELSTSITVPPNVTLDGAGHTIALVGDAEGFESAAIRTTGCDVVNLNIDGRRLQPLAPAYFAAIALAAPGRLAHVSVRNIHFSGAPHSAIGIEITAFDGTRSMAEDIALENVSGSAMLLTGEGGADIVGASIADVTTAVHVNGTFEVTLSQLHIEGSPVGIRAQDHAAVRIIDSVSSAEAVAEDLARIHHESLTFIGAGHRATMRQPTLAALDATRGGLG